MQFGIDREFMGEVGDRVEVASAIAARPASPWTDRQSTSNAIAIQRNPIHRFEGTRKSFLPLRETVGAMKPLIWTALTLATLEEAAATARYKVGKHSPRSAIGRAIGDEQELSMSRTYRSPGELNEHFGCVVVAQLIGRLGEDELRVCGKNREVQRPRLDRCSRGVVASGGKFNQCQCVLPSLRTSYGAKRQGREPSHVTCSDIDWLRVIDRGSRLANRLVLWISELEPSLFTALLWRW